MEITKRQTVTTFALVVLAVCIQLPLAAASRLLPFQGRLTDAQGQVVADGERAVQFKLYNAPVGGKAVWNGEVQKLTVNSGLVSTLLGSKATLVGVDFNQDLYLELTLDANGDGQITLADPPLLPRQAVMPSVFAIESGNSRLLNGYDWSEVLVGGSHNPASAKIRGSKIEDGGISSVNIANGAVTAAQIANEAIVAGKLAANSVSTSNVIAEAIGTTAIQDGSVTQLKLAPGAVAQMTQVVATNTFEVNETEGWKAPPEMVITMNLTRSNALVTAFVGGVGTVGGGVGNIWVRLNRDNGAEIVNLGPTMIGYGNSYAGGSSFQYLFTDLPTGSHVFQVELKTLAGNFRSDPNTANDNLRGARRLQLTAFP